MGQNSSFDSKIVLDLMRQALKKARGYADFWQWSIDKSVAEVQIVRELMNHLVATEPELAGTLSPIKNDPPDVVLETNNGRKIGIEVTELVDQEIVAEVARSKKHRELSSEWADWNADLVAEKLVERIRAKDSKLQNSAKDYAEVLLVVHTDEPMIDGIMIQEALTKFELDTKYIDRGYVILSYDPRVSESEFASGYPIFELPCKKVV